MKKIVSLIMTALLCAGLLAGCGGSGASGSGASGSGASGGGSGEAVDVTVTVWGPQEDQSDDNGK